MTAEKGEYISRGRDEEPNFLWRKYQTKSILIKGKQNFVFQISDDRLR